MVSVTKIVLAFLWALGSDAIVEQKEAPVVLGKAKNPTSALEREKRQALAKEKEEQWLAEYRFAAEHGLTMKPSSEIQESEEDPVKPWKLSNVGSKEESQDVINSNALTNAVNDLVPVFNAETAKRGFPSLKIDAVGASNPAGQFYSDKIRKGVADSMEKFQAGLEAGTGKPMQMPKFDTSDPKYAAWLNSQKQMIAAGQAQMAKVKANSAKKKDTFPTDEEIAIKKAKALNARKTGLKLKVKDVEELEILEKAEGAKLKAKDGEEVEEAEEAEDWEEEQKEAKEAEDEERHATSIVSSM